MSNPDLDRLQPYPFQRLAALREGVPGAAGLEMISLAMGEPRHPAPGFVAETLIEHAHGLSRYPATRGDAALREAICTWLSRRFQVPAGWLDPGRHALPVNGTREALFAFAQAMVDRSRPGARVLMPNPFYQIYEGAALLAGAEPYYLDTTASGQPDFDAVPTAVWQDCQLLYLCTPGNPTGAVLTSAQLQQLIRLADRYDFVIAADECYSEIYPDEANPPPGLLQACAEMGRSGFERCVVFHSLSKRSNLPGLRSGFVAGDPGLLGRFLLYRTYHGCAMPPATQAASIAAWSDEAHVRENRARYRQKFDAVLDILGEPLGLEHPQAGFYLWPEVPERDTDFTLGLWREAHVAVLPGSFLARDGGGGNPGARRVRMALVAEPEACVEAAHRIRRYLQ